LFEGVEEILEVQDERPKTRKQKTNKNGPESAQYCLIEHKNEN